VLETAGLVTIEKGYAGKRPRTWTMLTRAGRAALAEEIARLKLLISRVESNGTPEGHRPPDRVPHPADALSHPRQL
jgi:DNA-binding MarR family transcriptional regulator